MFCAIDVADGLILCFFVCIIPEFANIDVLVAFKAERMLTDLKYDYVVCTEQTYRYSNIRPRAFSKYSRNPAMTSSKISMLADPSSRCGRSKSR